MKILLINDSHHVTGGAENHFFQLKSRLKQIPGIEVYSIGFGKSESEGDDFYVFKSLKSNIAKLAGRLLLHPLLLRRLRQRIAIFQPDVIHVHNIKQHTPTVLRAIKPYPVVHTVHDFSLICPVSQNIHRDLTPCKTGLRVSCFWQHRVKFSPINYLLMMLAWQMTKHRVKKTVDAYTAPSPLLTDYLTANHFRPAHYISPFNDLPPNTIPISKQQSHHFLFAGSLAAHKGVDHLLDEFAIAAKQNPLLTLDIAGFGPQEHYLRDKVTSFGLSDRVTFLGWQTDLTPYYQQCTALLFPSIWLEAFGLVISEAMSHGRPIIGVNRGTTAWLVEDGSSGLLFDPLKKGDLAEKILKLAGNSELAMQLGARGRERISNLIDNDTALKQIVEVYRSVL